MNYILGSRGSKLALAQVELLQSEFSCKYPEENLKLEIVKTTGDQKQGTIAAEQSDKRDWIHELELGVVRGELDAALHSGKDVPCVIHRETVLIPVLKRATPYDLFIGRLGGDGKRVQFKDLENNAIIGTASLRRRAQLLRSYPQLQVKALRGNVPTRVRKLDEGEAEGLILAAAGVERLKDLEVEGEVLSPELMLPAVNQGMLAVQIRKDRDDLLKKFQPLCSEGASACFFAERTVAEVLDGDCRSAIAIHAEADNESLSLRAEVYSHDGKTLLKAEEIGPFSQATALGNKVGQSLLSQGARSILDSV